MDNGAGLGWEVVVRPGDTVVVSHLTFFSPGAASRYDGPAELGTGAGGHHIDPVTVAVSAAIAAGVVLFVPFPAALFNSTFEENYAEVMAAVGRLRRWFGRLFAGLFARGRRAVTEAHAARALNPIRPLPPRRQALSRWPPAAVPNGASTLTRRSGSRRWESSASCWSAPFCTGSWIRRSDRRADGWAAFLGLALGMGAMLLAFGIPMFVGGVATGRARALPGTLLVAAASVLISRLADFQPGYLYGLVIGFAFARPLAKPEEGKLDAVAAACALGLAVVSWILLPVVRGAADSGDEHCTAAILQTAFATVVVAGLEAAAIAMLPMRFLPGERARWNGQGMGWAARRGGLRLLPPAAEPELRLPGRYLPDVAVHRDLAAGRVRGWIGAVLGLISPLPAGSRDRGGPASPLSADQGLL